MSISEYTADTSTELTGLLADFIEAEMKQAISSRGIASLVVSGGNTPRPLFETLSRRDLPWHKITITLADERWVDPQSGSSNEAMIRQTLLRDKAAKARFIPLKNAAATAAQGQKICEQSLESIERPFDLVILGMGNDGHTASLFPEVSSQALDMNNASLCSPVTPKLAPHERMTLTARALLDSRKILLHIVGDEKWQVYQNARRDGLIDAMPVRVVLHQQSVPVEVYWSP